MGEPQAAVPQEVGMEKDYINSIEITRDEARVVIKALEGQKNPSDESRKVLEFLKRAVEAPMFDEVEGIPTWAISYLEYGEDDTLEEDERSMIDEFLEDNHYRFSSVRAEDDCVFDRCPQFGKPCNTCTCYFEVLPKGSGSDDCKEVADAKPE